MQSSNEKIDHPGPHEGSRVFEETPEEQLARFRMVEEQMQRRGIGDLPILDVMGRVPRHLFVPADWRHAAYEDRPLPIGHRQTISQPYMVALMTQLVRPTKEKRMLEVGAGCGYQTAVLAELCAEVCAIEIVEPLATATAARLADLGYTNVALRHGDGYQGWPERAPFDGILVTAAPCRVPAPLVAQLAEGGRLVIPLGAQRQELWLIEKLPDGTLRERSVVPVAFVPMTGEAARNEES